jgi:hypothetical protein
MGDLLTDDFYADLERDQPSARRCRCSLPPQMLNTMVPATDDDAMPGMPRAGDFTAAFYADPVRRYMLPVFSDRRTDWPSPPLRRARQPARARHVGTSRGSPTATPPRCWPSCCRPARSTAGTAPGWTWSATPPPGRQAQVRRKPADRHTAMLDYLRANPDGPRRRRLRRRRGQPAVEEPRGLPRPAARDRHHPRHPPGHQGAHGPAPALALPRCRRGHRAGHGQGPRPWGARRRCTPTSTTCSRSPRWSPRPPRRSWMPGCSTSATRACSCAGVNDTPRSAAGPVLRAAGQRRHHAVLLLHVRHDPVQRALATLAARGPGAAARDHGLPARLRHAAHRLRRAVRRQALGAPGATLRHRARHLLLAQELPHLDRGPGRRRPLREYVYYDPIHTLPRAASVVAQQRRPRRRSSSCWPHCR